ncbi:MAG: Fe-S protein assembly co-chaperone HscB [Alphaproteobacteria bacterium]
MSDNAFQLFDLEPTWHVDLVELEKIYKTKQLQYHPDRMVRATEDKKKQAEAQAAMINQAYETLKSPIKRAELLLSLRHIDVSDETIHDSSLLQEMFELQEELMSVPTRERIIELKQDVQSRFESTEHLFSEGLGHQTPDLLKLNLHRLRYLDKLRVLCDQVLNSSPGNR